MPSLDIVTLQSPFHNHLGTPIAQLLFHGRIQGIKPGSEKWPIFAWKDPLKFYKVAQAKTLGFQKGHFHFPLVKAIATVEPSVLVQDDESVMSSLELQHESTSGFQFSVEEVENELDDAEKLRRMRISKANSGKVPWNKGRKHSPETRQRIRERTWIAMQNPKVKMKLVNLGHAQSEETKMKIAMGVRKAMRQRREKSLLQENCYHEWQNAIAVASRKGFSGEEDLQWNSYEILSEQLKDTWLENVENRKSLPRSNGNKGVPKSLEQRRKISQSLLAKWADPEYRDRVCSGMAKYREITFAPRKTREKVERKKTYEPRQLKFSVREQPKNLIKDQVIKKVIPIQKKKLGPTYKDPMTSTKVEMIKKIREQRSEMENKKREAIESAKLLIADAEKAAKALEVVALSSPLARAALLEARKLIAEAMGSIENTEKGELASQAGLNNKFLSEEYLPMFPFDAMLQDKEETHINGNHRKLQYQADALERSFHSEQSLPQVTRNGYPQLIGFKNSESFSGVNGKSSPKLVTEGSMLNQPYEVESRNSDFDSGNQTLIKLEDRPGLQAQAPGRSIATTGKTKKKWVLGRLVEIENV